MNKPDAIEEQMRGWQLREPSDRLKERLFGAAEEGWPRRRATDLPWFQTLGASVVGCAAALFTIMNALHLGATYRVSIPFSPLSNHVPAMALASAPVNTWTAPILGWTNEGTVSSPTRPFNLLNTNTILP